MSISKSERFKIKVSGLPRFYSLNDPLLKEFLAMINSELRLHCVHARFTKKGNAWLYLSFESEASQLRALNALRRYMWRGRTLISTLVTADPVKSRNETPYFEEDFSRRSQLNVTAMEQVLMSTIPYHSIGYEEQLKKKSEEVLGLFKRFHNILKSKLFLHSPIGGPPAACYHQHIDPTPARIQEGRHKSHHNRESDKLRLQNRLPARERAYRSIGYADETHRSQSSVQRVRSHDSGESHSQPSRKTRLHDNAGSTSLLASWYEERCEKQKQDGAPSTKLGSNRFPFIVEKVRGSPIVDEYRNKAEFTVGINPDSNTLSVGPRIKSSPDGRVQVGPVEGLRHLPKHVIRCVKEFEKFVRASCTDQSSNPGIDLTESNELTKGNGPIQGTDLTQVNDLTQRAHLTQDNDLTQGAELTQDNDLTQGTDLTQGAELTQVNDLTQEAELTQVNDLTQVWKSIIIRTNYRKELMLILIADMQDMRYGHASASDGQGAPSCTEVRTCGEQVTGSCGDQVTGSCGDQVIGSCGDQVTGFCGEQVTGSCGEQVTGSCGDQVTGFCGEQVTGSCVEQQKRRVVEFFSAAERQKRLNVVSIYFQQHKDRSALSFSKSDLIWGREYFLERLLDLEIAIAGGSYFRINSEAARVLSEAILELSHVTRETTVLDLFCGSGSIALSLAKHCKEVIGIELLEQNILDANRSALLNGIHNCTFIGGKLEEVLPEVLGDLRTEDVVVILDPPRTGIIPELVRMLKRFRHAQRLIYICSDHKLPIKNLLDFCSNDVETSDVTGRDEGGSFPQGGGGETGGDKMERNRLEREKSNERSREIGRRKTERDTFETGNAGMNRSRKGDRISKKIVYKKVEDTKKKAERLIDEVSLSNVIERKEVGLNLDEKESSYTKIGNRDDVRIKTRKEERESTDEPARRENNHISYNIMKSIQEQIRIKEKRPSLDTAKRRNDEFVKNYNSAQGILDFRKKTVELSEAFNSMDEDEYSTNNQKHSRDRHNDIERRRSEEHYQAHFYKDNKLNSTEIINHRNVESIIIPEHIIPVDLSPHTLRTELVILCRRYEKNVTKDFSKNVLETTNIERANKIYKYGRENFKRVEKVNQDEKDFKDRNVDVIKTTRKEALSKGRSFIFEKIDTVEVPAFKRAKLNDDFVEFRRITNEDLTRARTLNMGNQIFEKYVPKIQSFQVVRGESQVRLDTESNNVRNENTLLNVTENNINSPASVKDSQATPKSSAKTLSRLDQEINTSRGFEKTDEAEERTLIGVHEKKHKLPSEAKDNGKVSFPTAARQSMQLEKAQTSAWKIGEETRDRNNDERKTSKPSASRGQWVDARMDTDESQVTGRGDGCDFGGKGGEIDTGKESEQWKPFSLKTWKDAFSKKEKGRWVTTEESMEEQKTTQLREQSMERTEEELNKVPEETKIRVASSKSSLDPVKVVQHLTQTQGGSWFLAKIMNDCENRRLDERQLECLKYFHPHAVREIEERAFVRGLAMGVEYCEEIRELMKD